MRRIRKTKAGWSVFGVPHTFLEMIALATDIMRAINGKDALKEEIPKSYSAGAAVAKIKKQSSAKPEDL